METSELIRKVKKIEIKAKGKSQDIFSGAYHTAFKGVGMSFAEVRNYQYGDDVRNIDWNVTARTSETQIKVFEEERELTVMLLIDMSKSNLFGSSILKKDLIAEVSGIVAINAMKNQDKVGAILFSDKIEKYIPPKKGRKHALRIISDILNFESSSNNTNIETALNFMNAIQKKRCVSFIFSDYIDAGYDNSLRVLSKKHDLIPVRIWDKYEQELPDLGLVRVRDSESGNLILIDTSDKNVRARIKKQFEQHKNYLEVTCKKYGITPIQFNTEEDYIKAFIKYFKSR